MAWLGVGRVMESPAIAMDGGRVTYVGPAEGAPEGGRTLSGDWFLMPGAVDHHVHIGLSDPRKVLRGGITVARDLAWPPGQIFPVAHGSVSPAYGGPLITAAGPMITAPGGYPSRAPWAPEGTALEVRGEAQVAAAVRRVIELGAALVKVAMNAEAGPTLSDGELLAACETAHAAGKRVTAHVQGAGETGRALGAGIDELAHCPWTERLPDDMVDTLARGVRVVSTMDIHSFGARTPELETVTDNLARFAAAGGHVRYGTDLGNGAIPPGIHEREAAHLSGAGLDGHAILRSMTAWELAPGARGDLVGLAGNPLEDVGAFGRVRLVVRAGIPRRHGRFA